MRRISYWTKRDKSGAVRGVAVKQLEFDCVAVFVSANVVPVQNGWLLVLDRTGQRELRFETRTRHEAMMLAEHEIAVRWGTKARIEAFFKANAIKGPRPDVVPIAEKGTKFWRHKDRQKDAPEPRFMKLLTPEIRRAAKLPMGEAELEAKGEEHINPATKQPWPEEVLRQQRIAREANLELERMKYGEGKSVEELAADEAEGAIIQ